MPPLLRTAAGLAAAVAVAWLGSLILGEYPFTGFLPIVGGFLLGVAVVGAQAFVERRDPPPWAVVAGAAIAVWGEWRAAWIDAGGFGPLPWEAYAAMAAAAIGALVRLIPPPRRRAERRARSDDGAHGGAAGDSDGEASRADPA